MDPRACGGPYQLKLDRVIADAICEHKPAFVYGEQPLSFPSSSKPVKSTPHRKHTFIHNNFDFLEILPCENGISVKMSP